MRRLSFLDRLKQEMVILEGRRDELNRRADRMFANAQASPRYARKLRHLEGQLDDMDYRLGVLSKRITAELTMIMEARAVAATLPLSTRFFEADTRRIGEFFRFDKDSHDKSKLRYYDYRTELGFPSELSKWTELQRKALVNLRVPDIDVLRSRFLVDEKYGLYDNKRGRFLTLGAKRIWVCSKFYATCRIKSMLVLGTMTGIHRNYEPSAKNPYLVGNKYDKLEIGRMLVEAGPYQPDMSRVVRRSPDSPDEELRERRYQIAMEARRAANAVAKAKMAELLERNRK